VVYRVGGDPRGIGSGDFNGDKVLDLVIGVDMKVGVLLGVKGGSFGPMVTWPLGGAAHNVLAVDLDGDARADIVAPSRATNDIQVLLNRNGTFPKLDSYPAGSAAYAPSAGDIDGDGDIDLAIGCDTA